MNLNHKTIAKYLSLLVMTGFTVLSIINKETSVFYIIYLFWCDEFIRTLFDRFRLKANKNQVQDTNNFGTNIKDRFFMLGIYFVFITIIFGLVINWKDTDLILLNFEVFLFKNSLFNGSIASFLLREIYIFFNKKDETKPQHLLSNGVIILHISIIFGIFMWFLSTKKFPFFEQYATILSIVPFLILKLIFELKTEE